MAYLSPVALSFLVAVSRFALPEPRSFTAPLGAGPRRPERVRLSAALPPGAPAGVFLSGLDRRGACLYEPVGELERIVRPVLRRPGLS